MIQVREVNFSYTKKPFLENINFNVDKGEIFGFLGPSGAGKSTLQKILTGLITDYQGNAVVNGIESKNHNSDFYERIGVDFEFPSLYDKLTAKENLEFFSSLYKSEIRSIEELLDRVGLLGDKDKKVSQFSKGMKSRLNFIKALVHKPDILFLDEPTSGLDPTNSRIMKDIILEERGKGTTIILTTHNMQDATELCDRVAFIVEGKVKALDTPHQLIMSRGATKVKYSYKEAGDGREKTGECHLTKIGQDLLLQDLIQKNKILSIHSSEPTLNEIFLEVTGSELL